MNKFLTSFLSFIIFMFTVSGAIAQSGTSTVLKENTSLAEGHLQIRKILGDDIGKMKFDTPELDELRRYLYNSLLTSNSNTSNNGSYSESSAKLLFCPDGSFVQVLSAMLSLDVDGASAYSGGSDDSDVMPGIWEVAVADGMYLILFYSTHPSMLEDSPNGFLPLPIIDYQENVLFLPGGDYYAREIINDCNY